jgi:hypothetical protein
LSLAVCRAELAIMEQAYRKVICLLFLCQVTRC